MDEKLKQRLSQDEEAKERLIQAAAQESREARERREERRFQAAKAAMQGTLASPRVTKMDGKEVLTPAETAVVSVAFADALLAELEKKP